MGCDIHCYIDVEERSDYVSHFAKVRLGRNYWLFGLMAGVRVEPGELGLKLLVSPRGLPAKNSYIVDSDNRLYVSDDEDPGEGCCERSSAERWVASGSSEWVDEDRNFVTHPDWHTHSYLYVEELKAIQEQYQSLKEKHTKYLRENEPIPEGYKLVESFGSTRIVQSETETTIGPHPELAATIAMMEVLNQGESKRSRLVFWFDN